MDSLEQLKNEAVGELKKISSEIKLDEFLADYFGRHGKFSNVVKNFKNLDENSRREQGRLSNQIKAEILKLAELRRRELKKDNNQEYLDLTAFTPIRIGHLHPITQIRNEIEKIFMELGFAIMQSPEIETDYYNFEALNMPPNHPARDMWDTFYLEKETSKDEKLLLRTHISPIQVRVMEKFTPPFAVISSGRVFRHEATDARHEHTYDYTEGFMVGENLSLANLKSTLLSLFQALFGEKILVKFRPSYFPFTEPSLELIMECLFCGQKGCSVCHTGWLEMLGAGMIHPKVFKASGYPEGKYKGFAFGIGISRLAMLKYNIPDIRLLYKNDQRMLEQF